MKLCMSFDWQTISPRDYLPIINYAASMPTHQLIPQLILFDHCKLCAENIIAVLTDYYKDIHVERKQGGRVQYQSALEGNCCNVCTAC